MQMNSYLTPDERKTLQPVRIGIAGAGGLGSNVLAHLVRCGLEHFVIADYDRVTEGNLNRQFFFRDQIGLYKTDAVAENVRRINPDLDLELHPLRITQQNVRSLFASCAIIVEAFDNAEAKQMLIQTLRPSGIPVVAASGLAGWGSSNRMQVRKIGKNLYLCGDMESGIDSFSPQSPRVGLAAALQANTVMALLLGKEI